MKKYILTIIVPLLAISVLLPSCKDDENAVTITINSPDTTTRHNGDMISINVVFTHNDSDGTLHNVAVQLINTSDNNAVVHDYSEHIHATGTYEYQADHTLSVTDHSDFRLVATYIDHDGTTGATEEVEFHCHPM